MKHGGIVAAAIDVLGDMADHHRPAAEALKDWGRAHRFAGSGDRAAIGNLVFDALRHRASIAWRMGTDTPRALALGAYGLVWGATVERIEIAFAADRHSPQPLTDSEKVAIRTAGLDTAPDWVRGDYPEWLSQPFTDAYGDEATAEGAALAARAPVDLRVNTLKAKPDKVLSALSRFEAEAAPLSPVGIRLAPRSGPARAPHVESEAGYRKGWFELQDEGSQLAALLSGAAPGDQVADLCAGAGGKTLALAAQMANTGQVYAFDVDRHRLAGSHERLQRAGVRNAQVLEAGNREALKPLAGRMDMVLVDAPCTGSGTWRRRPDAKWRVGEKALADRVGQQAEALALAVPLVKPGGRIVYVTCSMLAAENDGQVDAFLAGNTQWNAVPTSDLIAGAPLSESARAALGDANLATRHGVQLSPHRTGTDGFYVAAMARAA